MVLCDSETTEQLEFMKISQKFQDFLLMKITEVIFITIFRYFSIKFASIHEIRRKSIDLKLF
jgi:hypothetical protein